MTSFARAGSHRWLQVAVEGRADVLRDALDAPLRLAQGEQIRWVSPLRADGFAEFRDGEALRRLGVRILPKRSLAAFWPPRGPVWDALGKTSGGALIFVEAKAHISEAASPGTKASPKSRRLIESSLHEARGFYAPKASAQWSGTFYQYANRLAHHYLFRRVNGLPSHLVFLYFINATDVGGPGCVAEWQGAIRLLHAALGLPESLDDQAIHEVFVDVQLLGGAVG